MLLSTLILALLGYAYSQVPCSQYSYPCADVFAINWPVVASALPGPIWERNVRTTYLVACTAGSIQTCDFVQPMTMVVGPSTLAMNYTGLGGIGSVTLSMACVLTSTAYAVCTASGGVRVTSGPSSDVMIQGSTPATVTYTGSVAASLIKNVPSVYDSSSLLTYTPPGATVIPVTTVTTDTSLPSSTTSFGSKGQGTATSTSTPSSSMGSSHRAVRKRRVWKAFIVEMVVLFVLGVL